MPSSQSPHVIQTVDVTETFKRNPKYWSLPELLLRLSKFPRFFKKIATAFLCTTFAVFVSSTSCHPVRFNPVRSKNRNSVTTFAYTPQTRSHGPIGLHRDAVLYDESHHSLLRPFCVTVGRQRSAAHCSPLFYFTFSRDLCF